METKTTRTDALDIAAKAVGMRSDQVRRAVEEYRAASRSLEVEPEWKSVMHMSGQDTGLTQYIADGTAVTLQVESWKERGEWRQEQYYVFGDKPYEQYAEARGVELAATARPQPYEVCEDEKH